MRKELLPLAALLAVLWACPALAIDVIRTTDQSPPINGTIETIGAEEVTIKKTGGEAVKVPVNTISEIRFDGEPAQLNLVRSAVNAGNYAGALRSLENAALKPEDAKSLGIKQEILFFTAVSKARLALGGGGDIGQAGTEMLKFVKDNPGSWHILEANEVLGDLLVAVGKAPDAQQYYDKLTNAPWPDVKMRGAVAKGRALQSDGKFPEALAQYESAISTGAGQDSPLVQRQRLAATIGKAACLAETGKPADGIALIEDVVAKADPEAAELHAAAFTTQGRCYAKAGKPKDALLAFLKVDVLYPVYPRYHAEALYYLSKLWNEAAKQPQRAMAAKQLLVDRYGQSKWAAME